MTVPVMETGMLWTGMGGVTIGMPSMDVCQVISWRLLHMDRDG